MCREVTEKYASELMNLSELLLKAMSSTLGLDEDYLHMAFGGSKGISASVTEPPNLIPHRSACLPLDTKHSRENTKLLDSVGAHPRGEPKNPHFCHQDHK